MAEKKCPYCGGEVLAAGTQCPHCGKTPQNAGEDAINERLRWVSSIMGQPELLGSDTPILDERVEVAYRICPACGSHRVVKDEASSFLGRLFSKDAYACLACGHRQKTGK